MKTRFESISSIEEMLDNKFGDGFWRWENCLECFPETVTEVLNDGDDLIPVCEVSIIEGGNAYEVYYIPHVFIMGKAKLTAGTVNIAHLHKKKR